MTVSKVDAAVPNKSRFNGCKITRNELNNMINYGFTVGGFCYFRNINSSANKSVKKSVRTAAYWSRGFAMTWGLLASAKYLLTAADLRQNKKSKFKFAHKPEYDGFTVTPQQAGAVFGLSLIAGVMNTALSFNKPVKLYKSKYARAFWDFSRGFLVTAGGSAIAAAIASFLKCSASSTSSDVLPLKKKAASSVAAEPTYSLE